MEKPGGLLPPTIGSRPKSCNASPKSNYVNHKKMEAIGGVLLMTSSTCSRQLSGTLRWPKAISDYAAPGKERFARQNATSRRPSILLAFARCQPALRPQTGRHSLRNWRRREDPQPSQSVSKSGSVICDEETKLDLWLHSSNGDPATFTDVPTEPSITELS